MTPVLCAVAGCGEKIDPSQVLCPAHGREFVTSPEGAKARDLAGDFRLQHHALLLLLRDLKEAWLTIKNATARAECVRVKLKTLEALELFRGAEAERKK